MTKTGNLTPHQILGLQLPQLSFTRYCALRVLEIKKFRTEDVYILKGYLRPKVLYFGFVSSKVITNCL